MKIYGKKTQSIPVFSKICKKFSNYSLLKSLNLKLDNKQLIIATIHFFYKYQLTSEEIINAAIFCFSILVITSFFLSMVFNSGFYLIVGTCLGYILYYSIKNKVINEYNEEKLIFLKYIDIIFYEFLIILSTTKSIFDSIFFVSLGKYPKISKKFQEMIWRINHGSEPEKELYDFALNQPSEPLKERILSIIATNYDYDVIIEELEKNIIEKETEYQKSTKELDSKLILILGFCTFIPLLLIILILLNGWENNFLLYLFPLFFWLMIKYLKDSLLKSKFLIFGSFENEIIVTSKIKKKEFKLEFEEIIRFLTFFGNFLKRGSSLERSLIKTVLVYDGNLKPKLNNLLQQILFENHSFESAWDKFSKNLSNFQSTQIMNLIKRMLIKDSVETGSQIISIISQLKKNQNLIKKRELIYKSHEFKIKMTSSILGFILGLLTSLAPFFSLAFTFNNLGLKIQSFMVKIINYFDYFTLIVMNVSILIISSYNLSKIIQLEKPLQNVFSSLLIFGITWYCCNVYLFSMV